MKKYLIASVRLVGFIIGFVGFLLQNIFWLLLGLFLTSIVLAFLAGMLEGAGISLLAYSSHAVLISNGFWWIWRYTVELKEEKGSRARLEEAEERARKERKAEEERTRKERKAEEEEQAIYEAKKLAKEKMLSPKRSANSITKKMIASNGFLTNSEWDLGARAELIRKFGIQRFMFPPKPSEAEVLAKNLETTAFEVNLTRSLNRSTRTYSISPVVEYWIEHSAKEWLQNRANNGQPLPQSITFQKMAQDIGLPSFETEGFNIALSSLFNAGVLNASGNGGYALPALHFVEEILNTTKFRNLVNEYIKDGISIKVSLGDNNFILSEPEILFEHIIDRNFEKGVSNVEKF